MRVARLRLPDAFLIRYDGIDQDHRKLIERLNDAFNKLEDGKLHKFEEPLNKFFLSLSIHFQHENAEMLAVGYPELDTHRLHHDQCLERVKKLILDCRNAGFLSEEALVECFDTIVADIAKADLHFGEFLDSKELREAQ